MTQSELKELKTIGVELGAAKAENDRLRGLLREAAITLDGWRNTDELDDLAEKITAALTQQAEPADTYTAVDMATAAAQGFRDGQAAVEQAAAQDEREAFEARMILEAGPGAADLWIKGNPGAGYSNERVNDHRFGWVACLEWMATRPAQTEQQPLMWVSRVLKGSLVGKLIQVDPNSPPNSALYGEPFAVYAAPIAQTAPQPEQSGLNDDSKEAAMQRAFELGGLEDGSYHLESDELELVIRAALSAQGGE